MTSMLTEDDKLHLLEDKYRDLFRDEEYMLSREHASTLLDDIANLRGVIIGLDRFAIDDGAYVILDTHSFGGIPYRDIITAKNSLLLEDYQVFSLAFEVFGDYAEDESRDKILNLHHVDISQPVQLTENMIPAFMTTCYKTGLYVDPSTPQYPDMRSIRSGVAEYFCNVENLLLHRAKLSGIAVAAVTEKRQ